MRITAAVLAGLLFSVTSAFCADLPAKPNEIQAITKPSQDVTISFTKPGRVAELMVKDGDTVKAGQLVAKQDDSEEQAALEIAVAEGKDETRTGAQVKVRDQKEKTYRRKLEAGASTAMELDEALLDWQVGIANVTLSEFEHTQAGRKATQAEKALEKMRLYTPISGVVFQTMIKAGENVDNQNIKVMRIVNVDPLWIEAQVPFAVAQTLKKNDPATVTLSNKETREGKIIFTAPVADAAADTLLVRVEVPNPSHTTAGEHVSVSFTPGARVASGDDKK
jgi:RND family efflux transporter MFP subunit